MPKPTTPPLTDPLSLEHLAWLTRQNDRTDNTITSRRRVLRSVGNAGTATRDDLQAWWERRSTLKNGSRMVDLSHLRSFYDWCQTFEKRVDDPSKRIRKLRVESEPHQRARPGDLSALLDGDTIAPDLKRAVMLGAYAGLRVSESAALDWADVDDQENTITIRASKTGRYRVIDVSPTLIDWLGVPTTGSVVRHGEGWYTAVQLQGRINRAAKRLGLKITTHSLRHRWGTAAYQSSGDLLAVAEMMGHASTNSTRIYAEASSDVKKKIASAVMR